MRSGRKSEPPVRSKTEKIDSEKLKKQRRKSDTFLSIAKETKTSKSDRQSIKDSPLTREKSKSSSSISGKKNDETSTSKRKFLVPGNLFMDEVNKASMFGILAKKKTNDNNKAGNSPERKSKSKIPVPVSPGKSSASGPASKALRSLEDGKVPEIESNESGVGLKSCLHVYRAAGSVKKTLKWPQDSNLEQVRFFEVDGEERTSFRRMKSETNLDLLGLEETSVDDETFEEESEQSNAAVSPTKEILFQKCFGNVKPAAKLLQLPDGECYDVGENDDDTLHADETSKDLRTSPERAFSGEPLHKWQSGLLSEIMDEFPEEFPNEPGNQWDKIRKRQAVGIKCYSDSPAERAKICSNRREANFDKLSTSPATVWMKSMPMLPGLQKACVLPEEALNELDKFEEMPIRTPYDQFHVVPTLPAEYHGSTEVLEGKMTVDITGIQKRLSAPPGFCYPKNNSESEGEDSKCWHSSSNTGTASVSDVSMTSKILPRLKRLANYSFQ